MKKKIIYTIFFGCILYGCRPTLYLPVSADAIKQRQLLHGRTLYVNHCSSCHNLHFPKEFDVARWEYQLDEMQVRAKISDGEKQLIYEYLTSQL